MKNAVFWDNTPCGSCKNRRFGGKYHLHHQGDKNRLARNNVSSNYQPKHAAKKYYGSSFLRLLVTANVVPSSPILVTLMMEAIHYSETRILQEPHGLLSQMTTFFGGMNVWQWKPKYSEKSCPCAALLTTNPTWLISGSTPCTFGGKPATNRRATTRPSVYITFSELSLCLIWCRVYSYLAPD
jgi:hypothetical protein